MDKLTAVLEQARAEIHRRHRRKLRCIGVRADTDDLYQMVCVRAWRARSQCRGSTAAEIYNWVMIIANNETQNLLDTHLSAKKRTLRRSENRPPHAWEYTVREDPTAKLIADERTEREMRAARAAMRKLTPKRRLAVRLRYLRGWDYPRVAAKLGGTILTARTHASLGIKHMRELVASV